MQHIENIVERLSGMSAGAQMTIVALAGLAVAWKALMVAAKYARSIAADHEH